MDFDGNCHKWSTGEGHETIDSGDHEAKGQGHSKPKVGIILNPLGLSSFPSSEDIPKNFSTNCTILLFDMWSNAINLTLTF